MAEYAFSYVKYNFNSYKMYYVFYYIEYHTHFQLYFTTQFR